MDQAAKVEDVFADGRTQWRRLLDGTLAEAPIRSVRPEKENSRQGNDEPCDLALTDKDLGKS